MSACNASATDIAWYSGYSWLHRPKLPGGMDNESRNCKPSVGSGNDCDLAYDTLALTSMILPSVLRQLRRHNCCGQWPCFVRIVTWELNKTQQAIYKVVHIIFGVIFAVGDPAAD